MIDCLQNNKLTNMASTLIRQSNADMLIQDGCLSSVEELIPYFTAFLKGMDGCVDFEEDGAGGPVVWIGIFTNK